MRKSVAAGLFIAGFCSLMALIVILFAGLKGTIAPTRLLLLWLACVAYYAAAGATGGAIFGALRPLRSRYLGRFLTAYLIFVLVYGGASATVVPLISPDLTGARFLGTICAIAAIGLFAAHGYALPFNE